MDDDRMCSQREERGAGCVANDRQCVSCGYELDGQVVYFIADIDVALVRCPECGLQQPVGPGLVSARRARNVAQNGLITWLGLVTIVVVGLAFAIGGLARSIGYAASVPLGEWIGRESPHSGSKRYWVGDLWWERTGRPRLIASGRDPWGMVDWTVCADLVRAIPIGIIGGVVYHAVFLHATRRGHTFAKCAIVLVSLAGLIGYTALTDHAIVVRDNRAIDLAMVETGFGIMFASWGVIVVIVLVGLWVGGRVLAFMIANLGGPRVKAWVGTLRGGIGKPSSPDTPEPVA